VQSPQLPSATKLLLSGLLKAIRTYAPPDWRPSTRKQVSGPLLDDLHRKVKHKVDAVLDSLDGLCALTFVSDGHSDKTRCPIVNNLACSKFTLY
jgi:hypothetical protein